MKWTPTDIIALILVLTVAITLVASVARPTITGDKISPDSAVIIGRLLSAMLALIGVYLGNKMKKP